jgi:hypothetical protein
MGRLARLGGSRVFAVVSAIVGLLIPAMWLWTFTTPSSEAVRIRNAFLAELGAPSDFEWRPGGEPDSYRAPTGPATSPFDALGERFSRDGDMGEFERSLEIARHLMSGKHRGGPIMSSNAEAYRAITEEGRGYCADFTQVFSSIAVAAGIPVREWGFAFDAFGDGHAFNEIFDQARDKWILVDSFHRLFFVDPATNEPLSVLEVHDRLLGLAGDRGVSIVKIGSRRIPFRSDALALDYYRRGMPQLFLWWGNDVFGYERALAVRVAGRFSRALEQAAAIAVGVHPRIRIYPVAVSDRDVRGLFLARDRFMLACGALAVAFIVFGLQILAALRNRP